MAVLPAAAANAYQAIAKMGSDAANASSAISGTGGNFSDFLTSAVKDSISTIKQGEMATTQQVAGKANIIDVVAQVNSAEAALNTVVAVRDKVVQAYQSILNMPI